MPHTLGKTPTQLDKTDMRLAALAQSILRTNDPYTARHQERVASIALLIARKLGLPEQDTVEIYYAGIVHDIGKVAIPAEILSKPSRLSSQEMDLVRTHVSHGVEILRSVGFYEPVVNVVYQHHERLNGCGYPEGLHAQDITLGARIIAVSDVYEAMTSHRPYRPGLGMEAAMRELNEGSGRLYDANIVKVLEQLLENMGDIDQISLMGV